MACVNCCSDTGQLKQLEDSFNPDPDELVRGHGEQITISKALGHVLIGQKDFFRNIVKGRCFLCNSCFKLLWDCYKARGRFLLRTHPVGTIQKVISDVVSKSGVVIADSFVPTAMILDAVHLSRGQTNFSGDVHSRLLSLKSSVINVNVEEGGTGAIPYVDDDDNEDGNDDGNSVLLTNIGSAEPSTFRCNTCSKQFLVKALLDQHIQRVHTKKVVVMVTKMPLPKRIRGDGGETKPSPHCRQAVQKIDDISTTATETPASRGGLRSKFYCTECHRVFVSVEKLNEHKIEHEVVLKTEVDLDELEDQDGQRSGDDDGRSGGGSSTERGSEDEGLNSDEEMISDYSDLEQDDDAVTGHDESDQGSSDYCESLECADMDTDTGSRKFNPQSNYRYLSPPTPSQWKCDAHPNCNEAFGFQALLWSHKVMVHPEEGKGAKTFACKYGKCKETINRLKYDKYVAENHMFNHTKEIRFRCAQVGCTFETHGRNVIQRHVMNTCFRDPNIEKTLPCKYCAERFYDASSRRQHMKCHTENCICTAPGCNAIFDSLSEFQNHCKVAHNISPEEQGLTYHCTECRKVFKRKALLLSHKVVDHRVPSEGDKSMETFVCPLCDFEATSSHVHRLHMFQHTGEPLQKCTVPSCTFVTWEQSSLYTHNRRGNHRESEAPPVKESRRRKSECDICHKLLSGPQTLKAHKLKEHLGERPFKCSLCPYTAVRIIGLKMHMRNIHKQDLPQDSTVSRTHPSIQRIESTRVYTCDLCPVPRTFDFKALLMAHHSIDHPTRVDNSNPKMKFCTQCNLSTIFKPELRNHMFTHTEEHRFRCGFDGCDCTHYSLVSSMVHARKHKGTFSKSKVASVCDYCGNMLADRWKLLRHIRNVHKIEPTDVRKRKFVK